MAIAVEKSLIFQALQYLCVQLPVYLVNFSCSDGIPHTKITMYLAFQKLAPQWCMKKGVSSKSLAPKVWYC